LIDQKFLVIVKVDVQFGIEPVELQTLFLVANKLSQKVFGHLKLADLKCLETVFNFELEMDLVHTVSDILE